MRTSQLRAGTRHVLRLSCKSSVNNLNIDRSLDDVTRCDSGVQHKSNAVEIPIKIVGGVRYDGIYEGGYTDSGRCQI